MATAQAAIHAKAQDIADISSPLATQIAAGNKTQAEFDAAYADAGVLRHHAIRAFLDAGAAAVQTKVVGSPDPVAIQKFADVDGEAHLVNPSLKDQFYTDLAVKMKVPTFTDRARTFPVMQAVVTSGPYRGQGAKLPADRISPFSSRNHSVDKMYDITTAGADIDAEITRNLVGPSARPATIAAAKADQNLRKKAFRHLLATGRNPLAMIDTAKPISPWGTWYKPGEITVPAGTPEEVFAKMMTLGALQPEWYPNGTVVLNIERKLAAGAREIRKPTAFDGMMSALWVSRNLGANDYGVTGGGIGEFLEANVLFSEVTSATAVIPSDDFLADLQRVATQVANATGGASTPTEELLRGNRRNTSILNTSPQVTSTYDQVLGATTAQANSPGASPVAPGAATPTSAARPAGPAAAPGGIYDMRNGPRAP